MTENRRAFTLAELLVALTIAGVIAGSLVAGMHRHKREGRAATELLELRDQLRDGADVLTADISGISAAGGDIYPGGMGKNSVEFRSVFGASVICSVPSRNRIALPPNTELSNGGHLSFIRQRIDPGHGVFLFNEGETEASVDDSWILFGIASVAVMPNACGPSPYVPAADGTLLGYVLTLSSDIPPAVKAGAPIRLVERVRYALYQSSDSRWYLGYCNSANLISSCAALQPLAGPYASLNSDQGGGQSGLDFYYYAADGNRTANPLNVSRIDIAIRGITESAVTLNGSRSTSGRRDTIRVIVDLKNR